MAFVRIIHPDVAEPGEIPEELVDHYRARGWEVAPDVPEPTGPDAAKSDRPTRRRTKENDQ